MSKFTITGPGKYKNRNGAMVVVHRRREGNPPWVWEGVAASGVPATWRADGINQYNGVPWHGDIVGRWKDVKPRTRKPAKAKAKRVTRWLVMIGKPYTNRDEALSAARLISGASVRMVGP